jgi:hypothetical protein
LPAGGQPFGAVGSGNNPYNKLQPNLQPLVNPNNDIVIYAEGNVRVRGTISDPADSIGNPSAGQYVDHHVSLVTNGTAYIDGSILKGDYLQDSHGMSGAPPLGPPPPPNGPSPLPASASQPVSNSSIAIMAEQYVTINTTQFFAGPEDYSSYYANANSPSSVTTAVGNAYDIGPGQSLTEAFTLPVLYNNGAGSIERLFISQSSDGNSGADAYGLISAAFDGAQPQPVFQVGMNGYTSGQSGTLDDIVFPLNSGPFAANVAMQQGQITFQLDQAQSANNWLLHRAAILPADIRIEANLFSENNSFFVIPGPWFNDNANDSIDKAAERAVATTNPDFPLYGQPVDLQITVYGSVTENMPADIGDQTAWMLKWGWIPKYYGTAADGTVHPIIATVGNQTTPGVGIGLNFVYDPMEGYPYHQFGNGMVMYGRIDPFGRALPFAPNLPVSPDLIYSGQESEQNSNI